MRVVSLVISVLALSHTVSAQNPNACPNPTPYKAVPMQLDGSSTGPTVDPLKNDGMVGNITGGWCESPDVNVCPNPLGYQKGYFSPDNNPPFCFAVAGVRNRMVEIMVEALASGDRVCVTDTGANAIDTQNAPLVNLCGNGQVRACFAASSLRDELPISISCSDASGCSTSDTNFWYRVRVSNVDWVTAGENAANSAVTQPDMWCEMIKQQSNARYPSMLGAANEGVASQTTSQPTRTPQNSAQTSSSSILLTLSASLAAFIGMRM